MTFNEYYNYYLSLHQNKYCRRLHYIGQIFTILFIVYSITNNLWLLPAAPFVIYPFAWTGHFAFEKNEPAAFKRPLWAKACDWRMFKDITTGKIEW
tara:strand:+ start:20 stop:307 length:288 start_codon:yes stop_codon:yes gene_type:complete